MAKKKIWLPQEICKLKLTLRDTRQPIWRRLPVPAGMTKEVLHDALQVAMGRYGSQSHEFRIGQQRYGEPDPEDGLMGLPAVGNERRLSIHGVWQARVKAIHVHDSGDSWEHVNVVEEVLPPENCGGVPGCYNLLDAIRMLKENNARKGFFELNQFQNARNHLSADQQPMVTFA